MDYSELNLDERLQRGIVEAQYVKCTPVQEKVLQNSLDGSDLYVQSQTGTGKTAAFLISIMQEILAGAGGRAGRCALVLVPTRELAVQVEEEAEKLGRHTGLRFASFYGGVGYDRQVAALRKGVDIIIGTPGRIIDLTESKQMSLSDVGYLTIDEADRMFDMGFYPDLRRLIRFLPESERRQTMLFSATLNSYVKNLAWEYTRDAKEITIEAESVTVDEIDQELIHVSSDDKMRLLLGVLAKERPESVIIFCDTKKMCEIVSKRLRINGVANEYIIGDLPQSKRLHIMEDFKAGRVSALVATDVAARGIDVSDLAMVVNYDLPSEAENYVHRIGRTARAGKSGKAYTFCSERDVYSLAPIERYIEKTIPSRVAVEEDFADDKSRDVYIRLDSDERRGGSGSRPRSRGGSGARGKRDGERRQRGRGERRDGRGEERRGAGRMSRDELSSVARMTSDERMRYYKEKYGGPSRRTAEIARRRGEGEPISAGRAGKFSVRDDRRGGKPAPSAGGRKRGGARAGGRAPVRNHEAAPKSQGMPAKKPGLFGRLKSLLGRGK